MNERMVEYKMELRNDTKRHVYWRLELFTH